MTISLATMPYEPGSLIRFAPPESDCALIREFFEMKAQPVAPKHAATVMLLRDAPSCASRVQVFMMRRAKTMAFVPDAVVFPGGSVRADDAEFSAGWVGADAAAWAQVMGVGEADALALVVAAARELFEECGVLLAGDSKRTVEVDSALLEARAALEAHEISFSDLLERRGLSLRSDLLSLRSRWVTPEYHPRRYDTFFFAAALPAGQGSRCLTTEAVVCEWADPGDAVTAGDEGRLKVMPPTAFNLNGLARAGGIEAVLTEEPRMGRIMFEPCECGGEYELRCVIP